LAEAETDGAYIKILIALFCSGWAMIYADRTALYPVLKIIGNEWNLTFAQTGFIASLYFAFYVGMQVPSGMLGDRFGLKKILFPTYLICGLGLMLVGLSSVSYILLLFFIALHGFGGGCYQPSAYGITMHTIPEKLRGFGTSMINTGMSIGIIVGLVASGPIYLFFNNWRMLFLILSIPTIILALLYLTKIREVKPKHGVKVPYSAVIKDRNLMLIDLSYFCSLYGYWVILSWGPTFLFTERGVSLGWAGAVTAIFAVVSIPSQVILGRLSDRVGRKKIIQFMFPLSALTVFLSAYVQSVVGFVAAIICYGIVGGLATTPIYYAWVGDHVSAKGGAIPMGTALAVLNFSGMFSAIAAPSLTGLIADLTGGLVWGFYLGAILVAAGTFFVFTPKEIVRKR